MASDLPGDLHEVARITADYRGSSAFQALL
jgi:hypothetical protein